MVRQCYAQKRFCLGLDERTNGVVNVSISETEAKGVRAEERMHTLALFSRSGS